MPAALLVHENAYQPVDEAVLAQYDEQMAQYYLSRGSNTRRDTGATIFGALSLKKVARLFSTICISRWATR